MGVIDKLNEATTSQAIDDVLSSLLSPEEDASGADSPDPSLLVEALQEVAKKDFVNSKTRRKVSRFIENRKEGGDSAPQGGVMSAFLAADFNTVIANFYSAQSEDALKIAINNVNISNLSDEERTKLRTACLDALAPTMTVPLTRATRRRINRMVFAVSTPEQRKNDVTREAQAKIARATAMAAAAAAQTTQSGQPSSSSSSSSSSVPEVTLASLTACLEILGKATTPDEVGAAIDASIQHVPTQAKGSGEKGNAHMDVDKCLAALLARAAEVQTDAALSGPSKMRRKLARFVAKLESPELREALSSRAGEGPVTRAKDITGDAAGDVAVPFTIDVRPDEGDAGTVSMLPVTLPSLQPATSSSVATAPMTIHSLRACLALLRTARSSEDVVGAVEAATQAVNDDDKNADENISVPDVDACVAEVRRLLAGVCKEPDMLGQSKSKRRISRFAAKLDTPAVLAELKGEPLPVSAPGRVPDAKEASVAATNQSGEGESGAPSDPTRGASLYIVFFGQLKYSTTAADLESFLRSKGIEGEVKVRLLTDKKTGESKGSAFVELEGSREMNKALALHHSKVDGRRVNVERSCGGRNKDQRAKRIRDQRMTQKLAHADEIDAVVQSAAQMGRLPRKLDDTLMNRLYALKRSTVEKVLSEFEQRESKSTTGGSDATRIMTLRKLVTEYDEGGKNVDQSKRRKVGF